MTTWRRKGSSRERRRREGRREGGSKGLKVQRRGKEVVGRWCLREWRRDMGVRSAPSSSNRTDGTVDARERAASRITHGRLP